MEKIVFYHKGCPDGFGAAWSFYNRFGDTAEYFALGHGEKIPNVDNKEVFFVDICPKRDDLLKIKKEAKSLIVLDHHISAKSYASDLDFVSLDMSKSGAMLAWEYCFPNEDAPMLIELIQDRDLFVHKIARSRQLLACIDMHDFDFEQWDELSRQLTLNLGTMSQEGEAILQYQNKLVSIAKRKMELISISGIEINAVNNLLLRHEIATSISKDYGIGAAYFKSEKGFVFSLRSTDDCEHEMHKIAMKYGGGGHKCAAGFTISSLDQLKT